MNLCTLSNITVFVPSEKNHCHMKRETVRESDTVKLHLKIRFVEPDSTCRERSNAGHSLRCHTGMKGNRKCFSKQDLS